MADVKQTELQAKLEKLLGTRNVYYQPPSSKQMSYTAIRYSLKDMNIRRANNSIYSKMNCYELIVISRQPDDPVNAKIMELPYCSFDRRYNSDNLCHDVYTLYY